MSLRYRRRPYKCSESIDQVQAIQTPAPVQAVFRTRELDGCIIGDRLLLYVVGEPDIANATRLLPVSSCPECARPALRALIEWTDSITSPILLRFLNRVLLDPRIGQPLLGCRASQHDHHSEQGGLLVHSMEVLEISASMARQRLSKLELEIVEVAALLHDIGKLRAVGSDRVRPVHCKLVRHETQSNRLLEPHLEWLRALDPDIAAILDYTFDFLSQPCATRGYARFVGPEIICYADRLSAALAKPRRMVDLLRQTMPRRPSRFSHLSSRLTTSGH